MSLAHLLTTVVKNLQPGWARDFVAEKALLKQQLLVLNRSRQRARNLSALDRLLFGFWALLLGPRRIPSVVVIVRPSTLLRFHEALRKRKYRLLYASRRRGKPGPKGPSQERIDIIYVYCLYSAENESAVEVMGDEKLRVIAHELLEKLKGNISVDWAHRESARARMRGRVKRILRKHGYPPDLQAAAVQTVLQQAEVLSKSWMA